MKKIIVGIFMMLAFVLTAHSAAASEWNSDYADCDVGLAVGNYTTNVGIKNGPDGCWTLTSVSANSGDIINVRAFYDNTSGSAQSNVVVKITPVVSGSSITFHGTISSNLGTFDLGTATVNLSSPGNIEYGYTTWKKWDGTKTEFTSNDIINGGQSIGTIQNTEATSPRMDGQGSLVTSFRVSNAPAPQCTDPSASNYGGPLPCQFPPKVCTDYSASNYGGPLPCQYPPKVCTDYNASNYNQPLPCQYPPKVCTDYNASNYGGPLPCNYPPKLCTDYNATNYNGPLPCQYPQKCQDPSATNYGSVGTCHYPAPKCQDPNASNYNGSLPCQYPPRLCQDFNASNYNGPLPCQYPLKCQDPSASNYQGSLPCQYPPRLCQDFNASNYNGPLPCNYPPRLCQDFNAANYNGPLPCQYPIQTCKDFSASNYGGPLPCQFPPRLCQDRSAVNYNGQLPCQYPQPTPVVNVCAVTTIATNVTQNSATLNGLVSGNAGTSYFEYGTNGNFGSRTNARAATGPYSDIIYGLTPSTTYYFRFVSQCNGGLSYGQTQSFQTQAQVVVDNTPQTVTRTVYVNNAPTTRTVVQQQAPQIIQGTTVIGTASPIMLRIENRYQAIGVNDIIDYTVTYQNIGSELLTHPVLQVIVPKGVTIINSSVGTFTNDTMTAQLVDLRPGDGGVVYLQARVDSISDATAQIVTTAILVYTTPNGAQENAIAYVLNTPRGLINNLGAAAFFGGIFPTSLVGWLLLIIIILLVVLLARKYSHKTYVTTVPGGTTTHTTTY